MKSPKHLSHKPIISVNDYDSIDGHYANNTDARALSIGHAQYDGNEISLKVWRRVNSHWSRQSEELPIHRNLDLSILFVQALLFDQSTISVDECENLTIDNKKQVQQIQEYYESHQIYLEPRLQQLKQLLNILNI